MVASRRLHRIRRRSLRARVLRGQRAFFIMDPPANGRRHQAGARRTYPAVADDDRGVARGGVRRPARTARSTSRTCRPPTRSPAQPIDLAAERLRRRDLRAGGHQPRRLEGAGGPRDRRSSAPPGVVAGGVMTDTQQGVAQPARRQLPARRSPASAPSCSARGRSSPATRRFEQWRYVAGPADGAVHRAVAVRAASAGRSSSRTTRRCGTR